MANPHLDWSKPQYCIACECLMRPSKRPSDDYPNSRIHSSNGECVRCATARRRREAREKRMAEEYALALAEGRRQPTVRELWEMGHPCIEPYPLPR